METAKKPLKVVSEFSEVTPYEIKSEKSISFCILATKMRELFFFKLQLP